MTVRAIVRGWRGSVARTLVVVATAALFLLALAEVETGRWHGPLVVRVLGACLVTLPLLRGKDHPVAACVLVAAGALLVTVPFGTPQSLALFFALPLAAGLVTACADRHRVLCLALLGVVVLAAALRDPTLTDPFDYLFTYGAVLAGAAAGMLLRDRSGAVRRAEADAAAARAEQAARVAEAIAHERAGLARDLHDVVAHAVSLIVVQAAAGRAVLPRDPAQAAGAFDTIERTGQRALDELRRMLGLLDAETHPSGSAAYRPGLASLPDLVALARSAGIRCAARCPEELEGIPDGVDVAAYRILQESVTNALKHGPRTEVDIEVRRAGGGLRILVLDRGARPPGPEGPRRPGSGRGLVGMRERVSAYGGTLTIGASDGGWRVEAFLPMEGAR